MKTLPRTKVLKKTNKIIKVDKKQKKKPPIENIVPPRNSKKTAIHEETKVVKREKPKYVMPSKYINENVVNSSLRALQQLVAHHKKKNVLFDDEQPIIAEINCIKIQNARGNIKFVLPHSTITSTGEVCLITPDLKKGKKIDHEPTVDHWEELLRKSAVTEVKTVLPIRQLKVEYDQFELKRRLLTQHDLIMVDTRVLSHVSHILGKMFFKKHNMLIPVRIQNETDLKKDIDIGLRTAMLRVNEGSTTTILIGHTGMPQDKLRENVLSLVQQLQTRYPGGEANIKTISIKLPLSMSLPLYMTLRPSNTIKPPKLVQKKPKNFRVVEDELTLQNSNVRVNPDGTVRLVKTSNKESGDEQKPIEESDDEVNSD